MSTPHNDGAEHTHAPDDHAAHVTTRLTLPR